MRASQIASRVETARTINRAPTHTVRFLIVLVMSLGALSCQAIDLISAPLVANQSASKTATRRPTPTVATPTASPTIQVLPSPTATNTPTNCANNNSTFVSDVTIPDGTVIAPNQTFTKTWRLKNPPGKCAWGSGYQLAFVSGTAMTSNLAVQVPDTAAGETADVSVPMTAPGKPGTFSGVWRLRSPKGTLFGTTMSVKILASGTPIAAAPTTSLTPTACSGKPNAFSFTATAATITAGSSTTLQWGALTNAASFEIDQGIGGRPAPGSIQVSPASTTTYTATARCGSNTTTAQVTITVNAAGQPGNARSALGGTESGTVYDPSTGLPVDYGMMLAGDTSNNQLARAYMSFDISDLGGKTLASANLDLTGCTVNGSPFTNLNGIWVGEVSYSPPLIQSAYNLSSTGIVQLKAKPTGLIDVKSYVQIQVTQRKPRFQIRLHPARLSNKDNLADNLSCAAGVPKLSITY